MRVRERWERRFIQTAALIFAGTGVAKLISALGSDVAGNAVFGYRDPIFHLKYHTLFLLVGLVELGIAGYCLFARKPLRQLWVIGLFSVCLVVYRVGLWYLDYQMPCTCLGTLTDRLHLPPKFADTVMKSLLGYLLVFSSVLLASRVSRRMPSIGENPPVSSVP